MKTKVPPFYENFDDTHCAQCVLRGILEYFEPNEIWDWPKWDLFTAKEPDKWTWPYRGIMNMIRRGYDVVQIEDCEVNDYIDNGVYETLVAQLGKEAADICRDNADLVDVLKDMKAYQEARTNKLFVEHVRIPTLGDIQQLLQSGYLLLCTLNARALNEREGYSGHFVLVYDIDETYVYLHDSGLPGLASRKILQRLFIKACTDPTPKQWAITAFKK